MARHQPLSIIKTKAEKPSSDNLILELATLKNKDDLFDYVCKLGVFFSESSDSDINLLMTGRGERRSFYDSLIWELLTSELFNTALYTLMKKEEKSLLDLKNRLALKHIGLVNNNATEDQFSEFYKDKDSEFRKLRDNLREENKEEKQIIKLLFQTAFFPFTYTNNSISQESLQYINRQLHIILGLTEKFQNYQFHDTKILLTLNAVIYDIRNQYNKKFPETLVGRINDKELFNKLRQSRDFCGSAIICLLQQPQLSHEFKRVVIDLKKSKKRVNVCSSAKKIFKKINFIEASLSEYQNDYVNKQRGGKELKRFVDSFRKKPDTNSLFIIREMLNVFEKSKNADEACRLLTEQAVDIKIITLDYFRSNFLAFSDPEQSDNDWSNKIFIVSLRALSVLEGIDKSKNQNWKRAVFLNEMSGWITEVNKILNLHNMADDWDKIRKYLAQEGIEVEWKSSFYTATEQVFVDDEVESKVSKEILKIITKPMLAMMNTTGGTIVVGAVENPEKIKREDVKRNILKREGYTFFDINYEFEKKAKDIDHVKRDLQNILHNKTGLSAEKFNSLWSIETYGIKEKFKVCNIAVIQVNKSTELIYEKEVINGKKLITLTRRADGRNVTVDLEGFLKLKNDS